MCERPRLPVLLAVHLILSGAAAAALAGTAGYGLRAVAAHLLIVAEWDLLLLAIPFPRVVLRFVLGLTWAAQIFLYALNVVSTLSWDRTMTAHLVSAFAPTVWSGREPFPVGPVGITAFGSATVLLIAAALGVWGRSIDEAVRAWSGRLRGVGMAALAVVMIALFATTIGAGVAGRDNLYWKNELVASFFRPEGYAFEPTARREAMAARDAGIRAAYPTSVAGAHRKNVVLIIVDSLRADRMQVYGYSR